MKRITEEEAKSYIELTGDDPTRIRMATAYTLTPCTEPEFEGWENVTYYALAEELAIGGTLE
jgi:hypothetical protein